MTEDHRNCWFLVYPKLYFLAIQNSYLHFQVSYPILVLPFYIFSPIQFLEALIILVFLFFFLFLLFSLVRQFHLAEVFLLLIVQYQLYLKIHSFDYTDIFCLIHYITIFCMNLLHFIDHAILSV